MKLKQLFLLCMMTVLVAACGHRQPLHNFTNEVLLPMTPVKDQGKSELCWAYAMLATIETEHIVRGDSVNLSAQYVGRMLHNYQLSSDYGRLAKTSSSQRAMCQTLLNVIGCYGIVGYDVLPDNAADEMPTPKWVFMLGARYTPQEFAHSVCAPDEYISLTCFPDSPYYKKIDVPVPDNWEHNRLLNIPKDSLRIRVDNALRNGHPVCWESRGHAMEIVGMAHDETGRKYYVMKNSWGDKGHYHGLVYMAENKMWDTVIALYMTCDAYRHRDEDK